MKGWPLVFGLGLAKIPLKILAPLVVPFLDEEDRRYHWCWGAEDATDLSWWNIGVRNSVHNWTKRYTPPWWTTKTNTPTDPSLEKVSGLQYRVRRSEDDRYVSFRATWGKPRPKGKREFYIGWTLNNEPRMRLTFFQLRIF